MSGFFFCGIRLEAGGVGVADADEMELGGRPENEVLGEAREVHGKKRAIGVVLDDEIANRLPRPSSFPRRGQSRVAWRRRRDRAAGCSRDGAGTERQDVGPLCAVGEPLMVAFQHFDVGEKMMGEQHWLGALQMRVTGNDDVNVARSPGLQRQLQRGYRPLVLRDLSLIQRRIAVAT